ncbi:nuclear pore complex protein NUP107-like [Chenopodium quinoa]|uniref:nuclear pore complex protein NUP107-like n=1 Tax=Chenopodium quinoa TaxID=63459 RepID=UPI000B798B98|nr:nuclear pore complex protein NUP107-like [Chenopodium quinoa]XP_021742910.1 nuclear pore complex protein NUP107-like [Chenopodium quinoa]
MSCGSIHVTIGDGGNSKGLARRCCLPELILHCMQVFVSLVELFKVPDRLVELIELVACPKSGYLHLFSQQLQGFGGFGYKM